MKVLAVGKGKSNTSKIVKQMVDNDLQIIVHNQIKEIRERTGLSQSKFAEYFEIPTRTVQKWEIEQAKPPEYIPKMMNRILDLEEERKEK